MSHPEIHFIPPKHSHQAALLPWFRSLPCQPAGTLAKAQVLPESTVSSLWLVTGDVSAEDLGHRKRVKL